MSELMSWNFRSDRKYPNFILLRILLFSFSVILLGLRRFEIISNDQSESSKIRTLGENWFRNYFSLFWKAKIKLAL